MGTILGILNRKQAMRVQIDSSIKLYFEGDFISSLTLAAAAEDGTPDTKQPHIFAVAKEKGRERNLTQKDTANKLNQTKIWLKHHDITKSEEIDFNPVETVFMILRAITKYDAYYKDANDVSNFQKFIVHISTHPIYNSILNTSK